MVTVDWNPKFDISMGGCGDRAMVLPEQSVLMWSKTL